MFLNSEQREQVGFSFIIDNLQVMTPFGMDKKKKIEPFRDKESLEREFEKVEALIDSLEDNKRALGEIERVFCKVKDIRGTIEKLTCLSTLDDVELYEIKYFSMLMEELISSYEKLKVSINSISFVHLKKVIEILDPENKKLSTLYIYDSYSEDLKKIRTEKRRLEQEIFRQTDIEKQDMLREKRLRAVIHEEEEELNIRKTLTQKLSSYAQSVKENISSLGELDFIIAKAKLALKYNAVKPIISEDMRISLKEMFNPQVVEILNKKHNAFTPLTIELKSGAAVVTGANMGGKSVCLKTIVLNLLLGQCGFYVFAKEAKLPILDFIYFITDDMQSVSQGLSTFGAEIIDMKKAAEEVKHKKGFIALDEFARGTNPKEGFNLVKALCKYLNIYESISVVSTHYDGVVDENMVHYQVIGLKNVDFNLLKRKIDVNRVKSIDIIQENMDYRLERVTKEQEVPKDALNISRLLGLQQEILDIAGEYYEKGATIDNCYVKKRNARGDSNE